MSGRKNGPPPDVQRICKQPKVAMHRTGPLPAWVVPVLLVLLPLILYWPFVCGGKVLFWGTPLLQFWPWRQFAAGQLRAGQIPLWNPYTGNGTPLLADHQSAVLYPLNLIFWIVPVERAMGLSLALHAALAGTAMYALARDMGLTRLGRLIAALAFMFSGYMVARGSFLTEISALPWLPLIWLCARRLVRRRTLCDLALLSLVIALQFLAGHAQTWFYSMWAMGLYGVWRAWREGKEGAGSGDPDRAERKGGIGFLLLLLAIAWGVALAAAQFLPTLELSWLAGRAGRESWEAYALQYSFWPWRVLTLAAPDFFGNPARGNYWGYATYWEDAGYIGLFPLILAVLAVVAWFKRRKEDRQPPALREAPFWASLAALALVLAMGRHTPLYMLLYRYVPGFGMFQAPARLLCVYTPAMALLAGIGVEALSSSVASLSQGWGRAGVGASRQRSPRLERVCKGGAVGGLGLLLAAGIAHLALPGVKATFVAATARMAIWLELSFLLLVWASRLRAGAWRSSLSGPPGHRRGLYWQAAALALVVVDLTVAGYGLNPAIVPALYAPQTRIGTFLRADGPQGRTFYFAGSRQAVFDRYLNFGDHGPPSAAHWQSAREALLPDLGMVEGLSSANSFEPLVEGRYEALLREIESMPRQVALRTLGMMNVAYLLDPAPGLGEVAYRSPEGYVYRNPYLLPRAYVVYQSQVVAGPDQALAALCAPGFDPARAVILEQPQTPDGSPLSPADEGVYGAPPLREGVYGASPLREGVYGAPPLREGVYGAPPLQVAPYTVTVLPSPPNQVTIRAVLPQPGYLVLADTFYPGWQAFVDGLPVEIWRANYAFRAVSLNEGVHDVHWVYRPRSFTLGWICSASALAAAAAAMLSACRRRREQQRA